MCRHTYIYIRKNGINGSALRRNIPCYETAVVCTYRRLSSYLNMHKDIISGLTYHIPWPLPRMLAMASK